MIAHELNHMGIRGLISQSSADLDDSISKQMALWSDWRKGEGVTATSTTGTDAVVSVCRSRLRVAGNVGK